VIASPTFQPQDSDIFLYHSQGLISEAIRVFDGSQVNHAGIYLAPDQVGEALANGIERRSLTDSLIGSSWVEVMRLKAQPKPAPVRKVADRYLAKGDRYAYEQLLLLAFLCLTRRLAPNPFLRIMLRQVLDRAASYLEKLAKAASGDSREPMICSEFVYRAYDEALPDAIDQYSISISGSLLRGRVRGIARGVHAASLLQWATLHDSRLDRRKSGRGVRPSAQPGAAMPMDEALRSYLAYPGQRRGLRPAPSVDDDELVRLVDRFAIRYSQVNKTRAPAKSIRPGRATAAARFGLGSADGALASLWHAAADFVTPGDLERSDSLMKVGAVK
jgi:hypothetical protein